LPATSPRLRWCIAAGRALARLPRIISFTVLLVLFVLLTPLRVSGQPPAELGSRRATRNPVDYSNARFNRIIHALRIDRPPAIDGHLDEAVWERAEPARGFIQWNPDPGMPASDDTDVRFLYDDDNLYIGLRAWDSDPSLMTVTELREDFDGPQSDTVGVFIDTLHDQKSGFYFGTNPVGARRDFQVFDDDALRNVDWDGVWDVKASIDASGWTAEYVIPFKTLRFSDSPEQTWGLNILRRIRRRNEESHWSPLPLRYRIGRASMAGTLTGLENIHQGRNLKIKPFVTSSVVSTPPTSSRRALDGDVGVDMKYGVKPSVTLDITYRTDFSQVESDQQQVNLTRFNLFFPEKREFFLENSGVFTIAGGGATGGSTSANVVPFFSRRIGLSAAGTPIPLLGGARLSGKVQKFDIGLLAMRTDPFDDTPEQSFVVGRLRRNFGSGSSVGAISTSRLSAAGGDRNALYGADALIRLFQRKLELTSYFLKTDSPGVRSGDEARLVDATWRADVYTLSASYEDVQPNFRPDVGFVRRADTRHSSVDASWRPRPRRRGGIRNYTFSAVSDLYWNSVGRPETDEHRATAGILFQDSSQVTANVTQTHDRLDEAFRIASSVTIPEGEYEYRRYGLSYNTDAGRALSATGSMSVGEFWDGDSRALSASVEIKPSYHLNMEFTFSRNDVTLPYGDFTTNLLGARMLWAFTSKAFLNSFLQYNATTKQVSANTRFNLIHRPLSDLFIVYNERRDTASGGLLERGLTLKFTDLFDF
jgi:hypothetical protein